MIFSKFENLLKTISDDSIQHPKGHGMNLGKSWKLDFLRSGPEWTLDDVFGDYMYGLETCYVFLWEKKMSSCERRRCLLVGEEDVLLLEKNICSLDMI